MHNSIDVTGCCLLI